jgi:hypothetical protein
MILRIPICSINEEVKVNKTLEFIKHFYFGESSMRIEDLRGMTG